MKLHVLALGAALLVAGALAQPRKPALPPSTPVTLNFVNADLEAVTRAMANMIGQTIVVDPRVKGVVTLYSEQPIKTAEAYAQYLAALRGLGFSVVNAAGLLKVVPEADAKLQATGVLVGDDKARGDLVVTQVFQIRYENANNLVAVLRPLVGIIAHAGITANRARRADPASREPRQALPRAAQGARQTRRGWPTSSVWCSSSTWR